ncbi:Crp/Fnr family transcriptional regulator [Caulobacter sp. RL271]|jgi:CRP-like cAMP-binding protein|uniref:Crp/Fnr family transcriptional regulator n=1 Tax=Caulobacter segnis TaxID=88688 RepID=A0ABY4ZVJ8_9CAUL|nr:Crp/Fnr family transcriptional regulator [Caulobacter segnis]USQ96598.1 Crp/Fnr family transcriptional regulator [Caulobacter segnis]
MNVIPSSPQRAASSATVDDYRTNKLFRHMTRAEVESLGAQIEHLRYGKGEMIIQRRDEDGGIYLLLDGVLLANLYARSGREVGYRRILPGGYFGEIAAIDGLPRSVNIVALEDVRLVRLPQRLVLRLFEESPRFMRALLEDMASLTRALTDRLFELTAVSVACRVDIELLRMATAAEGDGETAVIHPCPTHAELAVLVGSQREPVTRELNRLASLNIVRQSGRTLKVLDMAALADEVERIGGEL